MGRTQQNLVICILCQVRLCCASLSGQTVKSTVQSRDVQSQHTAYAKPMARIMFQTSTVLLNLVCTRAAGLPRAGSEHAGSAQPAAAADGAVAHARRPLPQRLRGRLPPIARRPAARAAAAAAAPANLFAAARPGASSPPLLLPVVQLLFGLDNVLCWFGVSPLAAQVKQLRVLYVRHAGILSCIQCKPCSEWLLGSCGESQLWR